MTGATAEQLEPWSGVVLSVAAGEAAGYQKASFKKNGVTVDSMAAGVFAASVLDHDTKAFMLRSEFYPDMALRMDPATGRLQLVPFDRKKRKEYEFIMYTA
jgi:hypothetical protein